MNREQSPSSEQVEVALGRSIDVLGASQEDDGSWPGNYGGPLFLLPLYILTCRLISEELGEETQQKMERYIRSTQNPDGGFGLHVEGSSTVYGTCVNYVALRLLGGDPEEPHIARARSYLNENGTALGSASWGKFFLALLDLYPYEHLNPLLPELWLLPESLPVHPSRLWCHCRMVYLPMSYLYGSKARYDYRQKEGAPADLSLRDALRREIYGRDYDSIDWERARTTCAAQDNLTPQTKLSRGVNRLLGVFAKKPSPKLRQRALNFVLHQIDREDKNTNYICIGPINKLLNTLVWHYEDAEGPELRAHRARLSDYLFETELGDSQAGRGILMQGYNSSRLWDTAFAVQALVLSGRAEENIATLHRAFSFIEGNQVREDVCDRQSAYRHASRGGWPFSDQPHGWPISDCTAEGLKASLLVRPYVSEPLSFERMEEAARLILSLQNEDGGWATYELTRGPNWLEWLNPSDCFRDIMIDYSYVECTSACMQALALFAEEFPASELDIDGAISRGRDFLLKQQRADGSFEGSWGVCFTYGTWFGVTGLKAAGLSPDHPAFKRARAFLESVQRADGGFGESIKNCETRRYDKSTESQVVMTSWAVLALIACGGARRPSVIRGVNFILSRQEADGSYPAENIAGVFNKTCAIHYDNYLKIFPLWALSEWRVAAQLTAQCGQQKRAEEAPLRASLYSDIVELSEERLRRRGA